MNVPAGFGVLTAILSISANSVSRSPGMALLITSFLCELS